MMRCKRLEAKEMRVLFIFMLMLFAIPMLVAILTYYWHRSG